MPSLTVRGLTQRAVLWAFAGEFGTDGEPKVSDPVEVPVRWITKRAESVDRNGNTIALDATAVVDRPIAVNSEMALGQLSEWGAVGTGLADEVGEIMRVVSYSETPDVKGRQFYRTVGLKRFRDTLPQVV